MADNPKLPIPVILDTDIGTDIDDTWALAMLLRCPELELKLVTTCTGDTDYRAKIVARFLELSGRQDVGVAAGLPTPLNAHHRTQEPWVKDYTLSRYPGKVNHDAVGSLIETVMCAQEPVTLICIGPLTNIGAALEREPRMVKRARFVGMHGAIARTPDAKGETVPEYNVRKDPAACRKVFNASWEKTITPLDTCGLVRLTGRKYQAVAESRDPLAALIIENYEIWKKHGGWERHSDKSSVLFDCVAVHLAYSRAWLRMERIGIRVTEEGFTDPDNDSPPIHCAIKWSDIDAFEDCLVNRLTLNG